MLHEIFLSLLGFTGDIIVEGQDTFLVDTAFDLFTAAERQQINRIVPLGWFYSSLSSFVVFYEVKWGVRPGDPDSQFYRTAMTQGIADLLTEYTSDIAHLEQLVLAEGPIPLSHVLFHLQKYLLIMPVIHSLWIEVEKRKIWGCQLLDYIKSKRSGMPVVDEILQKMMMKVRAVFLKQCLAWMLYGELEDLAEEFFIQARGSTIRAADSRAGPHEDHMSQSELLNRFGTSSAAMWNRGDQENRADEMTFDWNTSFALRLELLPESHVSPRLASKILFCGKAVKLLLSANKSENATEIPQLQAIFNYLSGGSPSSSSSSSSFSSNSAPASSSGSAVPVSDDENNEDGNEDGNGDGNGDNDEGSSEKAFHVYSEQCGFKREDIQRISLSFLRILNEPHLSYQIFESLIEDIHNTLSGKLWILLREKYGFANFLLSMRNTFLMGKGELYQIILDGILDQTKKNIPDGEKMDKILKWDILKNASKILYLDDASLLSTLSIRVNSSNISLCDFSSESASISLSGGAKYEKLKKIVPVGKRKSNRKVFMCTIIEEDPSAELSKLWSTHILKRAEGLTMADSLLKKHEGVRRSTINSGRNVNKYTQGALWLPDQKYVAKGFSSSSTFECDWGALKEGVTLSHPSLIGSVHTVITGEKKKMNPNLSTIEEVSMLSSAEGSVLDLDYSQIGRNGPSKAPKYTNMSRIEGGASHLLLGGLSCVVHNDKLGVQVACVGDLGLQFQSAVTVGVSFHAHVVDDARITSIGSSSSGSGGGLSVQCYARVFITVQRNARSRFSRPSSGASVSSAASGTGGYLDAGYSAVEDDEGSGITVCECFIDLDRDISLGAKDEVGRRSLDSAGTMVLEVECHRELLSRAAGVGVRSSMSSLPGGKAPLGVDTGAGSVKPLGSVGGGVRAGLVAYKLRGRLRSSVMRNANGKEDQGVALGWDVEASVDLSLHVKLLGGQAHVGYVGSGVIFSEGCPSEGTTHDSISIGRDLFSGVQDNSRREMKSPKSSVFGIEISSLSFNSKGSLTTYPVASLYTSARFPDTFLRLEREVSQIRAWMSLKLSFRFPALFKIVFDSDAMGAYERLFSSIMKVRLVAHALEALWRSISGSQLAGDRAFCQVRQSMHFFVSNLLFHLQVDVVDSEYCTLQEVISSASDFQTVLRAHKTFIASIMRLSSIDNVVVQEGIDRVLQVCLRFISVCRVLNQQETDNQTGSTEGKENERNDKNDKNEKSGEEKRVVPIVIPPEELESVRKEFITQISYLFQVMRKVENRGLMFRLDFNGYLSALCEDIGAGVDR